MLSASPLSPSKPNEQTALVFRLAAATFRREGSAETGAKGDLPIPEVIECLRRFEEDHFGVRLSTQLRPCRGLCQFRRAYQRAFFKHLAPAFRPADTDRGFAD